MWLVKAAGKCRSVLEREGWTMDDILRTAGCSKLNTELEAEAQAHMMKGMVPS